LASSKARTTASEMMRASTGETPAMVLLSIHATCVGGQDETARRRIDTVLGGQR
jgi:hypothetical protein